MIQEPRKMNSIMRNLVTIGTQDKAESVTLLIIMYKINCQ